MTVKLPFDPPRQPCTWVSPAAPADDCPEAEGLAEDWPAEDGLVEDWPEDGLAEDWPADEGLVDDCDDEDCPVAELCDD